MAVSCNKNENSCHTRTSNENLKNIIGAQYANNALASNIQLQNQVTNIQSNFAFQISKIDSRNNNLIQSKQSTNEEKPKKLRKRSLERDNLKEEIAK